MKILLIDTCGAAGSIALADTNPSPARVHTATMPPRNASESLLPEVRRALAEAGWRPADLSAVAVVHGPGSFTGLRTGLSVGKGLCEVLCIPLVAVSRLAVLARGEGLRYGVLDAGRGEVYVGRYRDGVKEDESVMALSALRGELTLRPALTLCCDENVAAQLAGLPLCQHVSEPVAGDALELALACLATGADDMLGDANYVRCTDAEIFAKPMRAAVR